MDERDGAQRMINNNDVDVTSSLPDVSSTNMIVTYLM